MRRVHCKVHALFALSGGSGGHFVELGAGGGEGLFGGAFAGSYSGVDGAPVASDIRVFAGEVEGIFDGSGEFEDGVESAGGNVTVSAVSIGIGLPVMGGAAEELVSHVFDGEREDACEFLAGEIADLLAGALSERG